MTPTFLGCLTFCAIFNLALPLERFSHSLNGLWKFRTSSSTEFGHAKKEMMDPDFFSSKYWIDMPVPSSFNDVTTSSTIRDHVGWVWYWRTLSVLPYEGRYFLKFGKVHYRCFVWYNDVKVGYHEGGHIPFEIEITSAVRSFSSELNYGRLLIGINNTLSEYSLPQGRLVTLNDSSRYPPGFNVYSHEFDYFDYSGINGNVNLLLKPLDYVKEVAISTDNRGEKVIVSFETEIEAASSNDIHCLVVITNPLEQIVSTSKFCVDRVTVENPILWWPAHTFPDKEPAQLYILTIMLFANNRHTDTYSTNFGIREITITRSSLLLNGEPIYLKGFGMHEDAEIRGRGFDWVLLSRNMNLLEWTHANVVRTSHYPYSEEFIEMADKRGLLIIMETPACSLSVFDDRMLQVHKSVVLEMWKVFRNHPSIIMWSLANEPQTYKNSSDEYFRDLRDFLKTLDTTRLITFVTSQQIENEKAVQHADIICVNRYNAWYQDSGRLDVLIYRLTHEINQWARKFDRPVILTEYGAGSIAGLHELPSTMWSEDYQTDLFEQHFKAFDSLRASNVLAGELIWNFADFKTPQEYIRPGVCAKGIFTRSRQPKAVANSVRERYKRILPTVNFKSNYAPSTLS